MKLIVQYKRGNPDTVIWENLTITYTYSSCNKDEIDELEQKCKNSIGNVLIAETKGDKYEENNPIIPKTE